MVYPITAHAMDHQHDEDGGFVIEATTIQDPIGFATTLEDENGPLWGAALVEAVKNFRHWSASVMVNDDNNGSVRVDERGGVVRGRIHGTPSASVWTVRSSSRVTCCWPPAPRASAGPGFTTHVQGTCRMGSDPERSVVDADGQSWT